MDLRRLLFALALAAGLSACNTVRGVGEDVEAGGEAISNTAEEVQDDL
jgi:entericidin B